MLIFFLEEMTAKNFGGSLSLFIFKDFDTIPHDNVVQPVPWAFWSTTDNAQFKALRITGF